jgi:CHAD domain-containing protein
MVTVVRETERKYEAPPGARLPRLSGLPEVAAESGLDKQALEAEYYDTADLRLIRAGVTLRRRTGGHDAGWHLKLPAGGASRDEIRVPPGRGRGVPAQLAALVRVHTRGQELAPVALVNTIRRRRVLRDSAGSSLAEVVADDVSAQALGDALVASRWHEVEVELTGGGAHLLKAADRRLRSSGLRPAGRRAKLERALGDRLPARGRPRPAPGASAADVVLAYAGTQVAALKSADPWVRRDAPDAVHQMRVATRRLRSTLKSFRQVLRAEDTERIAAELKWLGGVLGEARDGEVLSGRLLASLKQRPAELVMGPVTARVRGHFAPAEAAARAALLEALDSGRYFALLDDLDEMLADPPLTATAGAPGHDVLTAALRRARRRVRRRLHRAWRAPAGPARDTALHEARKAAKDARYAAEAVRPATGKKARHLARRMKKLQSVLGDHHDAVAARATARDLGVRAHLAGENAFTFGLLYERDAQQAAAQERQAARFSRRTPAQGARRPS